MSEQGFNIGLMIFFGSWYLLSITSQFQSKWFESIREYDYFSLLPMWTFFAPNPGHTDQHIIFRDLLQDQSLTQWNELPIIKKRSWYSFIWNPNKRLKKIVADALNSINLILHEHQKKEISEDDSSKYLLISLPYIILLNTVIKEKKEPSSHKAIKRQFAVVETFGFDQTKNPELLFVSPFHNL